MSRITSTSELVVGTELLIDKFNRTIQLLAAGNLNFKDGVTLQAVYSRLVQLWTTSDYQDTPFPMYAIDALSGQFQIGTDGRTANGWRWEDDATRSALRDGGWAEYNSSNEITRIYGGFIGLGSINTGAQPYYVLDPTDPPTAFAFDDQFNVGVLVYGDEFNGDFDKRLYAKAFCREQGMVYTDSILEDTGSLETGAFKTNFLIANRPDLDVIATDAEMSTAPYDGITIAFYSTNQLRSIAGTDYPFRIIIEGNGANKRQIYSKVQYLLRQDSNINVGGDAGVVIGKTASLLMAFAGELVTTSTGVFIANIDANDANDYIFTDYAGVARAYPYVAAGTLTFNAPLVGAGSSFRLYYLDPPNGNNWGQAGAEVVEDSNGDPITGVITSGSRSFTFDYDSNTQAGYTAGSARNVVLVGVRPGHAKVTVAEGVITRSKGIVLGLVAEQDRIYLE